MAQDVSKTSPMGFHELHETTEVLAKSGTPEELLTNLTRAWQEQADRVAAGPGAIVRTCTINLVIFSATAKAAQLAERIMPGLAATYPCRTIHVQASDDRDAPLSATSHVHTQLENGVRTINCEQVTLKGGARVLSALEGVIAPLLSPDLPVVLWWRGDPPFEGRLFDHMVTSADRVIFDSSYFLQPEEDLPWATALVARNTVLDIAFTDVNWARLTSWRALIAQFFDGSANAGALDGIDTVTVAYHDSTLAEDRVSNQAWLLIGWLGSRLRWRIDGRAPWGGAPTFSLTSAGHVVTVSLTPVSTPGPEGLRAVELRGSTPRQGAYRVELLPDGCSRTTTNIDGMPPLERVTTGGSETYNELMASELEMPGRDQVYEEALQFAATLVPSPGEATA